MTALQQKMPVEAVIWGAAGLLPFMSTAVASVVLARQAATTGGTSLYVATGMQH